MKQPVILAAMLAGASLGTPAIAADALSPEIKKIADAVSGGNVEDMIVGIAKNTVSDTQKSYLESREGAVEIWSGEEIERRTRIFAKAVAGSLQARLRLDLAGGLTDPEVNALSNFLDQPGGSTALYCIHERLKDGITAQTWATCERDSKLKIASIARQSLVKSGEISKKWFGSVPTNGGIVGTTCHVLAQFSDAASTETTTNKFSISMGINRPKADCAVQRERWASVVGPYKYARLESQMIFPKDD